MRRYNAFYIYVLNNSAGYTSVCVLGASINKVEYANQQFRGIHNNVCGFGHEDNVFFPSLQMNVSFARAKNESLILSLGRHQGCTHVDPHDCICGYTVFTLVCSLPEGSDPGAFCFPESGTFAHTVEPIEGCRTEYGPVSIAFLVFKGRHLHGGYAPRPFWQLASTSEGSDILGVRIGLVAYPNGPAVNRTGTVAVGPPNGFSSSMTHTARKQYQRSMLQAGLTLFGTRQNLVNWIAREYSFALYNDIAMAVGAYPWLGSAPYSLTELVSRFTFRDEDGLPCRASTKGIIDPLLQHKEYARRCRLFAHMYESSVYFNLGVTKANVVGAREAAQKEKALTIPPFAVPDTDIPIVSQVRRICETHSLGKVRSPVWLLSRLKLMHAVYRIRSGIRRGAWKGCLGSRRGMVRCVVLRATRILMVVGRLSSENKQECMDNYIAVRVLALYPEMHDVIITPVEEDQSYLLENVHEEQEHDGPTANTSTQPQHGNGDLAPCSAVPTPHEDVPPR